MAVKLADAVAFLKTNDDDLKSGLAKGEKQVSGWSSAISGVLMGAGMAAFNAIAGAAQSAVGYMGDAVGAASDMAETVSKTGVLFGDSADSILAFAEHSAEAFGQSKQQALNAASTFAIFGKAAGLAGGDLADFSTDFIGLASDMASFHNTSPEDAIQAIGAALRGEAEPMRAYGVLLDDVAMRNKAVEMGLLTSIKDAWEPHSKILTVQAMLYEQTADAQGDFAKTQDGLANQQRKLTATMENMQMVIGQALLPVVLSLTRWANDFAMAALPFVQAAIAAVMPIMQALGTVVGGLLDIVIGGAAPLGDWSSWWEDIAALLGADVAESLRNVGIFLYDLRLAIVDAVGPALDAMIGWFSNLGNTIQATTDGPLAYMAQWWEQNLPRIQLLIENTLTWLADFWAEWGDEITATVSQLLEWITRFWDTNLRTLLDIVQTALQVLTGDWEGAGQTLKGIVDRWDLFVRAAFDAIWNTIEDWFEVIDWGKLGRDIIAGIAAGMVAAAGLIYDALTDAVGGSLEAMKDWLGIASPSARAAAEIGAPTAEGIVAGFQASMEALAFDMTSGLEGLFSGLAAPALATATSGPLSITINNYGVGDARGVGQASENSVLSALRSAGWRG